MNDNDVIFNAKQVSMVELVSRAGYTPVKQGSYYKLKEHDSFVIFPKTNSFCHYSQSDGNGYVGGSTIDFCMKYMGMNMKEALEYLSDMSNFNLRAVIPSYPKEEKKELILPERNSDNKRVVAYLCKTRGISLDVVGKFIKAGRLYESKDTHNCVFVTYEDKKPVYAFQRGTSSYKTFKRDVSGSDKSKAFPIYRSGSDKVLVFEAPIDMMSYITIYPDDKSSMIALGCLSPKGLYNFLDRHEDIVTVSLILDNDDPADEAYAKISEELKAKGYDIEDNEISDIIKENGVKDVNEYLVNIYNPLMKVIMTQRR